MNKQLQDAFDAALALPEEEQEAIAAQVEAAVAEARRRRRETQLEAMLRESLLHGKGHVLREASRDMRENSAFGSEMGEG